MYIAIETNDSAILEYLFLEQLQSGAPCEIKLSKSNSLHKLILNVSSGDGVKDVQPHSGA
jgi:hypothetical protein